LDPVAQAELGQHPADMNLHCALGQEGRRVCARPPGRARGRGLPRRGPPPAGWLFPGLAGLDVIAGFVLGRATVNLLPDVVKVVAPGQGRDNCYYGLYLDGGQRMAELTTIVMWCMGVGLELTIHPGWQNGRSRSETKIVM